MSRLSIGYTGCQPYLQPPCDGIAACNGTTFATQALLTACITAAQLIISACNDDCQTTLNGELSVATDEYNQCAIASDDDSDCASVADAARVVCEDDNTACLAASEILYETCSASCLSDQAACIAPCGVTKADCETACADAGYPPGCLDTCNSDYAACIVPCTTALTACEAVCTSDRDDRDADCESTRDTCLRDLCVASRECVRGCENTEYGQIAAGYAGYYDCEVGCCSADSDNVTEKKNLCSGAYRACTEAERITDNGCNADCDTPCCNLFNNVSPLQAPCDCCVDGCNADFTSANNVCLQAKTECDWEAVDDDIQDQLVCGAILESGNLDCEETWLEARVLCDNALLSDQSDCDCTYWECIDGGGSDATCSAAKTTCLATADTGYTACVSGPLADRYQCRYDECKATGIDVPNKCHRDCWFSSGCDQCGDTGTIGCCSAALNTCLLACPEGFYNPGGLGTAAMLSCESCGSYAWASFTQP